MTPPVKMRLERSAERDKREIINNSSADYGQSTAEAISNRLDLGEIWHAAGEDGRGLTKQKRAIARHFVQWLFYYAVTGPPRCRPRRGW